MDMHFSLESCNEACKFEAFNQRPSMKLGFCQGQKPYKGPSHLKDLFQILLACSSC